MMNSNDDEPDVEPTPDEAPKPSLPDADLIARHVQPWLDMVNAFKARVERRPGMATMFSQDALPRAERVCRALLAGQIGIPARHEVLEKGVKRSELVGEVEFDREAMLRLEARAMLEHWADRMAAVHHAGLDEIQVGDLLALLSQQRVPVPPGLMLKTIGPITVDSQEAFFEQHICAVLSNLDEQYKDFGTSFAELLPAGEEPNAEQWASAWTVASAAVAAEWVFRANGNTLRGAIRTLWVAMELPQCKGQGKPRRRTLPANDKQKIDLWASPFICQVLDHNPRHWMPTDEFSSVHIKLRDLDREDSRGRTFFRGRNVGQIYLAVWLERVALLLAGHVQGSTMNDDPAKIGDLPPLVTPELAHDLVQGQFPGVSALLQFYGQGSRGGPTASAMPGYFAGPSAAADKQAEQIGEPLAGVAWPVDVDIRRIEPRHVVVGSTDADLGEGWIGRIRLPWGLVDGRAQWLDFAMVIRVRGQWRVLPIIMEDEDADDPEQEWVALKLSPRWRKEWDIQSLRRALPKAEWVYRTEGLGVLMTGAIDLDGTEASS